MSALNRFLSTLRGSPSIVVLAFALLAVILEDALALYRTQVLQPQLREQAQQQAQVLA